MFSSFFFAHICYSCLTCMANMPGYFHIYFFSDIVQYRAPYIAPSGPRLGLLEMKLAYHSSKHSLLGLMVNASRASSEIRNIIAGYAAEDEIGCLIRVIRSFQDNKQVSQLPQRSRGVSRGLRGPKICVRHTPPVMAEAIRAVVVSYRQGCVIL